MQRLFVPAGGKTCNAAPGRHSLPAETWQCFIVLAFGHVVLSTRLSWIICLKTTPCCWGRNALLGACLSENEEELGVGKSRSFGRSAEVIQTSFCATAPGSVMQVCLFEEIDSSSAPVTSVSGISAIFFWMRKVCICKQELHDYKSKLYPPIKHPSLKKHKVR